MMRQPLGTQTIVVTSAIWLTFAKKQRCTVILALL